MCDGVFVLFIQNGGTLVPRALPATTGEDNIVGPHGGILTGELLDFLHAVHGFVRCQAVVVHVVPGNDSSQQKGIGRIIQLVENKSGTVDQELRHHTLRQYISEVAVPIVWTEQDHLSITPLPSLLFGGDDQLLLR